MRYKKIKGEITVFLTLLFSVLSALVLAVVESARAQAIRVQTERVMQTSIHSSFSEYNQDLYAYYKLLAIDSSYRTGAASIENVRDHLAEYAQENFAAPDSSGQKGEWLKIGIKEAKINRYQLLSDENGAVLIDQAVKAEQDRGQLPYRSDILRASHLMQTDDDTAFMNEFSKMLSRCGNVPDNPAQTVFDIAVNSDLLDLVIREGLPAGKMNADCASRRTLKEGTYAGRAQTASDETFLFDSYLNDYFGNYCDPLDHAVFACEKEYLIAGKRTEEDSLRECARMILAQREERNLEGLMDNESALHETEELAKLLCECGEGDPYYVQMSLLYAWSYAESVVEVSRLLHGGRVEMEGYTDPPVVPLPELADFTVYCASSGGGGEEYKAYLTGLMTHVGKLQKVKRCMDLIELNIRHAGHKGFRVDGSATYFMAEMIIESSYGYGCRIEREYGYMFP